MNRRDLVTNLSLALAASFVTHSAWSATHAATPRIALLGATARSGREIIRQGLKQGYQIKGLARTPSKLDIQHENLTLFKGDVREQASLEAFLDGDEVVVDMVGHSAPKDPMAEVGKTDLYTVMGANLIAAMKAKGNKRLIVASSSGVEKRVARDSVKPETQDMGLMWRWNARYLYNDMYDMELMIRASGLECILLRPGFLVEEPARQNLKINMTDDTPSGRVLTYADFSQFIYDNLIADLYVGKSVGMYTDDVMDAAAEIKKFLAKQKEMQKNATQDK
jgi:nucleoside-diphosphate-sugar epimerase